MAILLDETTKGGYDALTLASDRAAYVVASLTGTVAVEVYDSINVLRASGTMQSPWATSSGSTITVGEVTGAGINVTSGGVPDALWYCQFKSGTRFVRGTFGVQGSGRDFTWSLSAFETGSRGTIGTVVMSSTGSVVTNSPPVWTTVPTITITRGTSVSLPGQGYVYDPDNDAMTFLLESGTLPAGVTLNAVSGTLTAAIDAPLVTGAGPVVVSADDAGTVDPLTNTVLPAVSGTTTVGSILTGTSGTWTGTLPITYVYQWLRSGVPITSATASAYTLVTADVGALISLRVTATNPGGSSQATSATVGPITAVSGGVLSVPFTLTSATGGTLLPWTFGHAFKQGDWASGSITSNSGEFQANPVSYWPDGSVKHAVIAGRTTLTANVALQMTLAAGAQTAGATLTTTDLQSAIPASTTITVSGTTMTLASTFLASPQYTVCTGAVMSNWIYRLAVSGSNHLVIWADVRLYKGGTVEIFPWVENAYLNVASPASTVGTSCAVVVGGVSKFSQSIDIKHHTRIPLLTQATASNSFSYWSGTDPLIAPKHDRTYLMATKMVPNYGYTNPSEATLGSQQQLYTPNTLAGGASPMDSAGGSGSIIPSAQALYITSGGDVRAYRAAMARGLSSGSWSIHYRDETTNDILKFSSHPNTSTQVSVPAGTGALNGTYGTNITTHQPSFGYLPYLITGRWWFWEESAFWATMNYLQADVSQRRGPAEYQGALYFASGSAGVLDPRNGSFANRGAHWSINRLSQVLALCPTSHSTYADWLDSWEKNVEFYKAVYVDGTFGPGWVSPQGVLGGYARYSYASNWATSVYGEGFESNYGPLVWGFASDIGLPQSAASLARHIAVRDHAYKQVTARSADGASSYNWRRFSVFSYPIGVAANTTDTKPTSWYTGAQSLAILEAGFSLGSLPTTPGLSVKAHSSNTDMALDSSTANDFFPAPMAALAYAVDHAVPGASAGWARISGASNFTSALTALHANPAFGIVPRS